MTCDVPSKLQKSKWIQLVSSQMNLLNLLTPEHQNGGNAAIDAASVARRMPRQFEQHPTRRNSLRTSADRRHQEKSCKAWGWTFGLGFLEIVGYKI